MRATLLNLSTLMTASFVVQTSNAAITTMIGILIALRGGSQSEVALIAGCYSAGFVIGCFLIPSQAARIGLIRAYAASAAVLTMTIVGLHLLEGTARWALLRFVMGAAVAAVLAVSDAWINAQTPREVRGRVIAVYSIVLGLGSVVSQLIFMVSSVDDDGLALMFAVLMNIAVVLVCVTSTTPPAVAPVTSRPFRLFTITSTTAVVAVFLSGFSTVAIVTIVPFYLTEHGVPSVLVALSLLALYLGRLLSQWPVGALSDRLDRRTVLGSLSVVVSAVMIILLVVPGGEGNFVRGDFGRLAQVIGFVTTMLLGAALFPIYSVATSLGFDRADDASMLDVSTTLLVVNSLGSIAGPFTVMFLADIIGEPALPLTVLSGCIVLAMVAGFRRSTSRAPSDHTPARVAPESSLAMAHAAAEVVEEQGAET